MRTMNDVSITQSLFITDPTNIRYLTGFVGVAPEEREAYVLRTEKQLYLFTNALYIEQAKQLGGNVIVIEISRESPISSELAKKVTELKITKLGFEETNLTVAELAKLKQMLTSVELVPTRDTIEKIRRIKRPDEIETIRQACKITDDCFTYILTLLKPGVTESEIAWEIQTYFRKRGEADAFSPIVAFNADSSMPHYMPGAISLKPNSIVLLDFGARVNGYCADMTRVVFVGKPKDEWIKTYETVLSAEEKALELLATGIRSGATLDEAAQTVITSAGLPPYPHSLGHNVGLAIHESPRLSIKQDQTLLPGMVFSVEPGVYLEGQYGVRIEDLVLLKENGIEILSTSKKELMII
jgi:Xaa-Pro aminopeptidase